MINETHVFRFIGETGSQIFLIVSALTIGSLTYTCIERPWVRFVRYLCSVNAMGLSEKPIVVVKVTILIADMRSRDCDLSAGAVWRR